MSDAEQDEKVSQCVYQKHLPILQDPHRMRQLEVKFGHHFYVKEQFEAFAMLPIPDQNRAELIKVMLEARAESNKTAENKM